MKIKEIYNLAIEEGIKADPRSRGRINKLLKKEKEAYKELNEKQKQEFDKERLTNPYADTRILNDSKRELKKILVGIDIDVAEVLLAKELGVDGIIAHHPLGPSLAKLDQAVAMQADVLAKEGIPINIAESLTETRMSEISRGIAPANHYQVVDAAKLMDIPLANIHTPADNMVYKLVKNEIKKKDPEYIKELIELLKEIPEYKLASKMQMGPQVFAGSEERRTGKIVVTEMTGGTGGSKDIYEKMSQYGIGTIVGMHMEEEYKKQAEKYHINVVIAGHMASDSVGMNLLLKKLENKGIEIIRAGGLLEPKTQ
jgi:putative NIF3 family GTP cyclohydrolase 1 type 2